MAQRNKSSGRGRRGNKRRTVAVFPEGARTEVNYFDVIKSRFSPITTIKSFGSDGKSAPHQILKRVHNTLREWKEDRPAEIWIVVDRNNWSPVELDKLVSWAKESPRHRLAFSNPNFEYWLLLHFENAGRLTSAECLRRLKKHIPGYRKGMKFRQLTSKQIFDAISRAKRMDSPPCVGWPRDPGVTTVYRLLESILEMSA